jgi:hypothetical protein
MEWLPSKMWLTYLQLSAPAGELDYDLAISVDQDLHPTLADAGVLTAASAVPLTKGSDATPWPLLAGLGAGLVTFVLVRRARRGSRTRA